MVPLVLVVVALGAQPVSIGPEERAVSQPPDPVSDNGISGCYRTTRGPFRWEVKSFWAVSTETLTYEVTAAFTSCTDEPTRLPWCYAIPGNGQAPRVRWYERPLVGPGQRVRAAGAVRFRRRIYDFDELICHRRIAKTYVH